MPYRLVHHLALFRKSQRLPAALSLDGIDNPRKSDKESKEIINRQRKQIQQLPCVIPAQRRIALQKGNNIQIIQKGTEHIKRINQHTGYHNIVEIIVHAAERNQHKIPDHPRERKGVIRHQQTNNKIIEVPRDGSVQLIFQEHMGNFQFTDLPPLPLRIKFIDALDRIYHENGVVAQMYLLL